MDRVSPLVVPAARLRKPGDGPCPAFPFGLGLRGVHEVCETAHGDMAALTGFALAASQRRKGVLLHVVQTGQALEHGDLLAEGVRQMQAAPPAILTVRTRKTMDTLWTIEEAVRSGAAGLVLAEVAEADFTASRRLALASGRHGVPVILLMPHRRDGATAASARWRVAPRPSATNRFDPRAPGRVRWRAVLERSREVPHLAGQGFDLEWNDETLSLTVVSGLAADTPAPGKARRAASEGFPRAG